MNHLAKRRITHHKKRALATVIATGCLLIQSGCGIPNLRRAQPGPALPQTYERPSAWNQDEGNWDHEVHSGIDQVTLIDDVDFESTPDGAESDSDSDRRPHPQETEGDDEPTTAATKAASSTPGHLSLTGLVRQAAAIDLKGVGHAEEMAVVPHSPVMVEPTGLIDANANANANANGQAEPSTDMAASDSFDRANRFENSTHLGWHGFFNDPFLAGLIDQALAGNQELKILAEEIQIACNETYARSGEYRPFVNLGVGAGLEKPGRHTRNGAVEDQLEVVDGKAFPDPLPDFLVGAKVSWELDIWKKLRNAQNAAAMRYLGTQEGRNYVVTRLVAEVAENYYELLSLDSRLATLDKTIEIQQASLETAQSMKDAGRGTELAVQRFLAEVRKNQSEKLIIEQEIIEVENRINFLLGRYPQPVDRMSEEYIDLQLSAISAGVPAQLLQNRPDIREAEREVQAAGLDIRVARARFYPSVDLSAGIGYQAFSMGYLFRTPESLIYGIGGDLIAPLINKRAIKAAYRTANAKQLQAIYEYQRTVLNAYTEVINQLTKVDNYDKSIEIKKQQLVALEASVDSATKLFQNARAEYVEVLLAQREMMEAKMLIIDIKQQQLSATVNAYQALGGGAPADFSYAGQVQ